MKILFLHPNMPGQYKHLCNAFAKDPKNQVVFITKPKNFDLPNVHKVEYNVPREASISTHRYLTSAEIGVIHAQEIWKVCAKLKATEGFIPDVICCHPGWGDALYLKDIYHNTPILSFLEFFYRSHGADVDFDKSERRSPDDEARVRTKNVINLMNLDCMDFGITPTLWQHSLHPDIYKPRISVLHDGIDTDICTPDDAAELVIGNQTYKTGDETVTYIARNFEPYRGFPTFMKAAEIILQKRPNCRIIVVGADEVSYGKKLGKGETWRHKMMAQVKLDESRIIFPGMLSYHHLIKLFQISRAHIYLTYPFVLSWSSMEAMSSGCAMISSRTAPVMELMNHGEHALLCDFFSPAEVAEQVIKVLEHKDGMREMRASARAKIVNEYALHDLLPLHQQLIIDVANKQHIPTTHTTIMQRHDLPRFEQILRDIR